MSLVVLSVLFHAANNWITRWFRCAQLGCLACDFEPAIECAVLRDWKIPSCCRYVRAALVQSPLIAVRTPFTHAMMSKTPARKKEEVDTANVFFLASTLSLTVGILVDSEIDLSTRYGEARVFINKTLSTETCYRQDLINTDHLSTRFVVSKLGQGMRCCKCSSTSNVFVCETQRKEYMYGCVCE